MKTENIKQKNRVFGISVCNPVDIEREYLLYTVDYAIKHKMNHIQFIGPIHNPQKGNVDGMTIYRKYSAFNFYNVFFLLKAGLAYLVHGVLIV